MTILQVWFPFLRRFRRNSNVMKDAQATMRRIGLGLIEERVQDKDTLGRDILSILVRSNAGASASSESMSAEEVLCQISTFIAAGHETTASALTWCLYALIQNPDIQLKLREELGSVEKRLRQTNPGLSDTDAEPLLTEQLAKCQYLDWFIREALRLHAPITSTMRVCMRDEDVVPVSDTDEVGFCAGNRPAGIRLKKMDIITIPIQAINKSKNLWGDDALLFRPERWAQVPGKAKAIPGLYSSILTFLNGNPVDGNRACIGYKFALLEMKIFLYALVKDIEFRAVPSLVIEKKINVVTRPFVKSEPGLNNQLPVLIRRAVPLDTYMTP
ncbi:unnamed protein product [Mycena citricolor]|uniref:Cytochrome P450 n=1 Tax=Mycena citricolor TaxID=2018698 RepID=A0AAD2HY94_9AGAR|nr:unnamed protein product [Mycena citricolor]CAK5284368.1 unnamed protein product [Mycena citricolor]